MKNIKIKHEYSKNESEKLEEKKIKWFIESLIEKYSLEAVEMSINKIDRSI
ncbi:hypothetical protein CDFC105_70312 [Clostridioides difficile]|nr:hypothetical protein CDFC105_62095 [Clostridioides difficile]CZS00515.1 hypothetical protein CDFC105_70312 [Clostridioides difficile]